MIVTYSPEGQDSQRWEFKPRAVKSRTAEDIERRYGAGWSTWVEHVHQGQASARRVLLWHLLKGDHPTLRWDDVPDFAMGELQVELSRSELIEARDRLLAKSDLDPDTRDLALSAMDREIAAAPSLDDAPEGKATASSAG